MEQSWNLWQLTDRFSAPGSHMKLSEESGSEDLLLQKKKSTGKPCQSHSFFPSEFLCPCTAHHLSRPLFLAVFCPPPWARGAVVKANVTAVPMLRRGNWLLSLGAVSSHMLMFSYSRETRRGTRKDLKKVRITTPATAAEERPLLSRRERHYLPNPSVPESGAGFWSGTSTPAFRS